MDKQEQLQKVEEKIATILDLMVSDEEQYLKYHALFTLYMDRRQELKKTNLCKRPNSCKYE